MDAPQYYVRVRGVVSGPFELGQLQTMRRMKQLARFHEVSPDRKTWVAASTVAGLFPAPAPSQAQVARRSTTASQPAQAASTPPPSAFEPAPVQAPAPAPAVWFYDTEEQSVGPITLDELNRLIARGRVERGTLVWAEGMPTWVPYDEVASRGFSFTSPEPPVVIDTAPEPFNPGPMIDTFTTATDSGTLPSSEAGNAPTCQLAVASLMLGLTGWTCGIGSLLALAVGLSALEQINESQGRLEGKSLAIVGMLLGGTGVALDVAMLIFFLKF